MKVTLCIDSKESIEIGHSDLATLVGCLDDDMRYAFSFLTLVNHPASEVRSAVACKTSLPINALEVLAADASIEVVRQVANSERALQSFELPLVQAMIRRDVSIAADIAENLPMLSESVRLGVIQNLLQHDDPRVVEAARKFGSEDW